MKYIDLGLPFGTLWNERTRDFSKDKFDCGIVPTKKERYEYIWNTKIEYNSNKKAYIIEGLNGNKIVAPKHDICFIKFK